MPCLGWTIFYLWLNAHLESAAQTTQSQWPQKSNSLPWPKPNWSAEFLADSAACFAKRFSLVVHTVQLHRQGVRLCGLSDKGTRENHFYTTSFKKNYIKLSKYLSNYESAGILRLLVGKAQSRLVPPDDKKSPPIWCLTLHWPTTPDLKTNLWLDPGCLTLSMLYQYASIYQPITEKPTNLARRF